MSAFRNAFTRHSATKKSAISRTAEREFEREYKRLELLDDDSKKIYKDMKHTLEAQVAQCRSESKMTSDLLNGPLCKEDPEFRDTVEKWHQATHQLELRMNELNATSYKAVAEPMKKFCAIFPSIQAAAKRREQSLQELNRWQAKLEKYSERERTGPNRVKMQQSQKSLNAAKDDYDGQNTVLMEDMPRLYDQRIDYIDPSFQALIKSQIKYYTETHQLYTELCSRLQNDVEGAIIDDNDQSSQFVQKKLEAIKALTITMDK